MDRLARVVSRQARARADSLAQEGWRCKREVGRLEGREVAGMEEKE